MMISLNLSAMTFDAFQALSVNEQIEYLYDAREIIEYDSKDRKFSSWGLTEVEIDEFKGLILASRYIPKALKAESELYTEIHDDLYGFIGPLAKNLSFVFSEDQKFLGTIVTYRQQGCSHEDQDESFEDRLVYYETEAEANQNHCFDNDVSWTGSSYLNSHFQEIGHSDYMEWSGH